MLAWLKTLVSLVSLSLLVSCKTSEPNAIFNKDAVYLIPPEGLVTELVDEGTMERTGKMFVPPGVVVYWED